MIAEIETSEEPRVGHVRRSEMGINAIAKLEDGKHARVVLNEQHVGPGDEPTLRDVREVLIAV